MAKMKKYLLPLILILMSTSLLAQDGDLGILTLNRIFASREFSSERFGPARWLEDGSGYTTLERNDKGGRDIVRYVPGKDSREILVPAERLIPSGDDKPLAIANYIWSEQGDKLLIFTNTARVWRQNTRGDYWVLNLKNWDLKKLGGDAEPSTLMFAKFSPDGGRVAYVIKNNIYVEDLSGRGITQLTFDGSDTIINGTFDWVYEEEFGDRDGFRWSPDGKYIAYWRLDASGVGIFSMINNTDSLYPRVIQFQYPKVGTTNSSCRVGVVPAAGGATVWMQVPGDTRDNYIARMEWAANSKELMIQHLNRYQNRNEIMFCDAKRGKVRTVFTDKDDAWTEVCDDVRWLKDKRYFTWVSEQDGWRHVYLIDRETGKSRLVTPGNYDVISVECIDVNGGYIYFIASPDNPTQRYLYRVRLKGGSPQRLTPTDMPGQHSYQISPDGRWAIHSYSSANRVPQTGLVSLPRHKRLSLLVENKGLEETVAALKKKPVEFFRVNIGEAQLDGMMIKPYNFDPSKKYPVLFYVYSEPAGQTVVDRWGGSTYLWHVMLSQEGYIVISVDNRGTPSPRGRAWRKSIYKKIGQLNPADQAAAVRVIREWSFVDPDRIGVWGWSGGGSATLNAMLQYPDLYKTGMSVAPVPDQHLYDTIYQERYMGLPQDDDEPFIKGSPITYAKNLKGNLLIVHGTGDDNVHYQGTERLINELVKYNKPFTMMAYPNRSHGIYEGPGTTLHLRELLTRYLRTNLPAGPR